MLFITNSVINSNYEIYSVEFKLNILNKYLSGITCSNLLVYLIKASLHPNKAFGNNQLLSLRIWRDMNDAR